MARVVLRGRSLTELAEQIGHLAEECGRVYSERGRVVYEGLVCGALAVLSARGVEVQASRLPNRVSYFLVLDELPELVGLSRPTVFRALKELEEAGLVFRRAWYTTGSRQDRKTGERSRGTVAGGVVLDVVLTPERATTARVSGLEMRHQYRHLEADMKAGRTAWQWLKELAEARAQVAELEQQAEAEASSWRAAALRERAEQVRQSYLPVTRDQQITHLLRWTLQGPQASQPPVTMTVSRPLEAVYSLADLSTASAQERGELIDERARALCVAFGDASSNLNMWRRLLWGAFFADKANPGELAALTAYLVRLVHDLEEWGEMRSAGAVLVARLHSSGWWHHLEAARLEHKAA